jgi:RHS repeat-associated protein
MARPQWDETNYLTAFDPSNRRGRNPVYSAMVPRSSSIDSWRLYNNLPTPDSIEKIQRAGIGNYQLSIPVVRLAGRGLDLALDLTYNSLLWHKDGNNLSFNIDNDWPAPGWSLGFGKIIRVDWTEFLLFGANGTRHQCKFQPALESSSAWSAYEGHSIRDGTFIDCRLYTPPPPRGGGGGSGIYSGFAKYPDGRVVEFNTPGDDESAWGEIYPGFVTDRHGNYLTISYRNNRGPAIDSITDTLGRIFTFHYDTNNLLTAITGPGLNGSTRTLVRLHYRQFVQNYVFHPSVRVNYQDTGALWMIDAIYYPATSTGYWFGEPDSFSPYGMVAKVIEQRGMGFAASSLTEQGTVTPGTMTRQQVYNYPLVNNSTLKDAPKYTKMTETWAGMDTPQAVTNFIGQQIANPRRTEVTSPDGTRIVQLAYNTHKTPLEFLDGVVYQTETYDAANRKLQQMTMKWEQGHYDSPRIKRIEVWDELNQMTKTEYHYGPAYNQVTEVQEYDYGGTVILRRVRTEYDTAVQYIWRHIFNLPKVVQVYKGNEQAPTSRIEFSYDGQPLANTPGVVQYKNIYNPYASSEYIPLTSYRGNITQIKKYADAAQLTGAVIEKRRYDITGNLIMVSDPSCCEQRSITYNQGTRYAYPINQTRGAADPTSAARMTTYASYDINTGLLLATTDANGRKTEIIYSPTTLQPETVIWPTLASISYDYDDAQLTATETIRDNSRVVAGKRVKKFNGLGVVHREETLAEGGLWDIVETQYDALGRMWKKTLPFRGGGGGGSGGETLQWSEVFYDALGRVIRVRAADGSEVKNYYNESVRPPGVAQTVRTADAWGRERWIRTNALGQLSEVVEPNPNGNGSIFEAGTVWTYYRYNAFDQLVQVVQGPQSQTRDFRYDSLGRLTHQSLPEKDATLNDAGEYGRLIPRWSDVFTYDEHSNLTSHIDARGVKTIYEYADDPLNRLQAVRYDTTGFGDTANPILQAPNVTYVYMTTGDVMRLRSVTTQGVCTQEYGYNSEGRLSLNAVTMTRQPAALVTNYSYDSLNRLTDLLYPAQLQQDLYPPREGDMIEATEGLSSPRHQRRARKVVHYDYGVESRLKKLRMHDADYASQIVYNAVGQMTSLRVGEIGPLQLAEDYVYDAATGFLVRQKVQRVGGTYGRIEATGGTPPESTISSTADEVGRAGTIGPISLLDLSYGYLRLGTNSGQTGQLTGIVNNLDKRKNRRYIYDTLGRLRGATGGTPPESTISSMGDLTTAYEAERVARPTSPNTFFWEQVYDYDHYGNRTKVTASGNTASGAPVPRDGLAALNYYTNKNQITVIGFPYPGFTYDKAGNLTRGLRADGGAWQRYRYDAAGRLRVITDDAGDTLESYVYGPDRHRLIRYTGHLQTLVDEGNSERLMREPSLSLTPYEATYYAWSGDQVLEESTETERDVDLHKRTNTKSYVYLGERLLATLATSETGEVVQYHHADRLGTRLVTNAADASIMEQATLPFGVALETESTGATNQRFTSYDRSAVTGLDYAVNRYYDSQEGRFMQVDPLGIGALNLTNPQSLNLYAYVSNDPINFTDPTGLRCFKEKLFSYCIQRSDWPEKCVDDYETKCIPDFPEMMEQYMKSSYVHLRGASKRERGEGGGGDYGDYAERALETAYWIEEWIHPEFWRSFFGGYTAIMVAEAIGKMSVRAILTSGSLFIATKAIAGVAGAGLAGLAVGTGFDRYLQWWSGIVFGQERHFGQELYDTMQASNRLSLAWNLWLLRQAERLLIPPSQPMHLEDLGKQ